MGKETTGCRLVGCLVAINTAVQPRLPDSFSLLSSPFIITTTTGTTSKIVSLAIKTIALFFALSRISSTTIERALSEVRTHSGWQSCRCVLFVVVFLSQRETKVEK